MEKLLEYRYSWGRHYQDYESDIRELVEKYVDPIQTTTFRGIVFYTDMRRPSLFNKAYINLYFYPALVREEFLKYATPEPSGKVTAFLREKNEDAYAEYKIELGYAALEAQAKLDDGYFTYIREAEYRRFQEEFNPEQDHDQIIEDPNVFEGLLMDNYPDYYSVLMDMGHTTSMIPTSPDDLPKEYREAFDRVTLRINLKNKATLFRSSRDRDRAKALSFLETHSSTKSIFKGDLSKEAGVIARDQLPSWLSDEIVEALGTQKQEKSPRKKLTADTPKTSRKKPRKVRGSR